MAAHHLPASEPAIGPRRRRQRGQGSQTRVLSPSHGRFTMASTRADSPGSNDHDSGQGQEDRHPPAHGGHRRTVQRGQARGAPTRPAPRRTRSASEPNEPTSSPTRQKRPPTRRKKQPTRPRAWPASSPMTRPTVASLAHSLVPAYGLMTGSAFRVAFTPRFCLQLTLPPSVLASRTRSRSDDSR